MKKLVLLPFITLLFACGGDTDTAEQLSLDTTAVVKNPVAEQANERYVADANQCTFEWVGYKTGGEHSGEIPLKEGVIEVDNGTLTGRFELDMMNLLVLDIEDEAESADLAAHLKDPDFFSVDSFPSAVLEFGEVELGEPATVKGVLIVKGIEQEVEFPATITTEEGKLTAEGKLTFDRTVHGIRYKSKSILGEAADKFIYDEVEVRFAVVAKS